MKDKKGEVYNMKNSIAEKTGAVILSACMIIGSITGVDAGSVYARTKASLSTKKITLNAGSKKTIKLRKKNAKCTYSFTSNKKKIAKVSKKGVVTGVKKGTAKITVKEKAKASKKYSKVGVVTVTVKSKKNVTSDKDNSSGSVAATVTPAVVSGGSGSPEPAAPTVKPTPSPTPLHLSFDFSDGDISKFKAQGDGVRIELSDEGYNDMACLKATNRQNRNSWTGCGMGIDLSKYLVGGKVYNVTCYVKCKKDTTMTMRSLGSGGGWFNFPSQVGDAVSVKGGQWSEMKAIYAPPDTIGKSLTLFWDAEDTADIYVDSIEITESKGMDSEFKDTFSAIFGNIGTCNTFTQMRDNKTFTSSLYNSVTMENETKPNSIIAGSNFGGQATISSTPPEGYIIPESYVDPNYLVLNFSEFDNVINTAYEYGFKIRFHVLVWHSQTPDFFFKTNFNENGGYVSKECMNGRMEYYIRNVINHIYNTPHGKDVVYCIDVANEYFHNYDQGNKSAWNIIYYPQEKNEDDRTNKPEYVKRAFQIAYDELKQFGLEKSVGLFYNDYNTYEVADDIETMINYINEEERICSGVGMQSHLDVKYPSIGLISSTIDQFTKAGFEIQITELDVTDYDNSGLQPQYYADLITMLVSKKKAGADITGLTFWGLCDTNSWRRDGKPLLFSALFCPKDSYYRAIEAAKTAWEQ